MVVVLMHAFVYLGPLLVRLVVVEQLVPVILSVGQQLLPKGVRLFRPPVEDLKNRVQHIQGSTLICIRPFHNIWLFRPRYLNTTYPLDNVDKLSSAPTAGCSQFGYLFTIPNWSHGGSQLLAGPFVYTAM